MLTTMDLRDRMHCISRAATAFALMALVEGDPQGPAPR